MGINFKATIKRGEPMPSQCAICGSCKAITKSDRDAVQSEQNKCYDEKPEAWRSKYQPFTNSKRTIISTCKNFSHMRSCTYR